MLAAAYGALNFTMLQRIGLPDRARHRDGLLPVHRLVDVLVGVRRARRPAGGRAVLPVAEPVADQFLLLTQVIIFLLGWPLEWTEIIIIFVPIFLPLLDDFGIDPIFFGILVALNTQTAFNTPPVAMAAFYLKGVAPPQVKLTDIFSGALPFVVHGVLSPWCWSTSSRGSRCGCRTTSTAAVSRSDALDGCA